MYLRSKACSAIPAELGSPMFEPFSEISFCELFSDKPSVSNASDAFPAGITEACFFSL